MLFAVAFDEKAQGLFNMLSRGVGNTPAGGDSPEHPKGFDVAGVGSGLRGGREMLILLFSGNMKIWHSHHTKTLLAKEPDQRGVILNLRSVVSCDIPEHCGAQKSVSAADPMDDADLWLFEFGKEVRDEDLLLWMDAVGRFDERQHLCIDRIQMVEHPSDSARGYLISEIFAVRGSTSASEKSLEESHNPVPLTLS